MVEYYKQRASAGLIITEGTSPSPNGLGYPRIPGIYSDAQVAGWKKVTDAVHSAGAKIFIQLMHTGRVGHPNNLPSGARVLGPSAVVAAGEMYTDAEGPKAHPVPHEMTDADIKTAIGEYAHAAKNARAAGFDGVELHGANGYLIEQFIRPNSNQRRMLMAARSKSARALRWRPSRPRQTRLERTGSASDCRLTACSTTCRTIRRWKPTIAISPRS